MFQGVKKILAAAFLAASAFHPVSAQSPPCLWPPSQLASWWPGDDHLLDRAGQNHGFFRNGAKHGPGKAGQGFEFDGQDDYIEARADGMAVRQGDFSIEGWCKTTATKEWSTIAEFEGHAPGFYVTGASGALRLWPAAASASGGFNDGQFHHFAVTRRDGTITYYKDGAAIGTASYTSDINQNRFFIGHDRTAGGGFGGVIDELAFYTRALSDAEVASIAATGSVGKCKPSTPLPSLPFFIEAEDFNFDGGQHLASASAPGYLGAAYAGKSAVAGIDYNDPGANESASYRAADQGVAVSGFYDFYRDSYELTNDYRIGWIDAGDWFNYTRVFPLPARDYHLFARLSSAGLSNAVRIDLVTAGANAANQTLSKIGEARGPATGDWNNFRFQPTLNDAGELAVVRLGGEATLRVTALPESNQDFGFLQLVPVPPATSEPCAPAPAGMAAWWPGEGSGEDRSSAARHGVLTNGIAFTQGKAGRAFSLDGQNDYVDTSLDAQPSALPTTTWEAWVFPSRPGPRQQILSTDDGGYDRSVLVEGGGFGVFTGWGVWVPTLLSPNQWQHIAVVFSPTNVLFYKNGIRFVYGGAPAGQGTIHKLQIGRNPGFGEYFQGQIDEVAVYDRALSTEEIQGIFRAGSAGKCDDDCPPLAIAPASLPAAQNGTSYSQALTASGGTAPHTFSLASGALPPNFSLSPQGMLSGTTSANGDYSFLVSVTDANGCGLSRLFTLTISGQSADCAPAPAGLSSWWKAEDNTQDSTGSNHGTIRGGVSYTSGAAGRAFQFDGAGMIEARTNGLHVGLGDFSVEGWVKTTATRSYSTLISFDAFEPGFYVRGDGRLGHFHWSTSDMRSTDAGFNDGQWHHFAIVRQGGFLSYYKDGRPSGTHTTPYNVVINPAKVYIGGDTDAADYMTGAIDELSFYNRALAASEVRQIFAAGSLGKCEREPCAVITLKPSLPDGRAQADYNQLLTAAGGASPYTFALAGGALPPGIALSGNGELQGRSTTAGSFQFVVTATDQAGCDAQQAYTVVIQTAPTGPEISLASSTLNFGPVSVGQAGEQFLTIRNTGGEPLTISAVTSSNPRFSVAFPVSFAIGAGTSANLVARFAPLTEGEQTGQLSVASNDPDEAVLSVTVSGSGLAAENTAPWRLAGEALPSRQTRFTAPHSFILQTATNLTPPVAWTPLTNQPAAAGNAWSVTVADSMAGPSRFFRGLSGTNLDLELPDDWKPVFPVVASGQGMITAASGGTIALPDGATVEVPAGSAPQDTLITVTKLDMSEYNGGIARSVYRVEAGNVRLLKPATLTLPLPAPRPGDENAEVHVFRETDGEDVVELPAVVNRLAGTVQVTTDRFSLFGVEADSSYLFNYATVGSTVGNHLLEVPYYAQGGTMWCFAAASQMLMKYYGVDAETWQIARFFKLSASDGAAVWRLWAGNYRHLFSVRGLKVRETCAWMMAARFNGYLIEQIDAGRPVWVGVQNAAHAIVVTGYNAEGVFIHDPSGYSIQVGTGQGVGVWQMASHFLTWTEWKKAAFTAKLGWNNLSPMPVYTIVLEGARDPAASPVTFNLLTAEVTKNATGGEDVQNNEEMALVRPLPRGAAPLESRFSFDGRTPEGYKFFPEISSFGPPYSAANSDEMHLTLRLHNAGLQDKTAIVALQLDGLDIYRSPAPFPLPRTNTLEQLVLFSPTAPYRFLNGPDGALVPGKYPLTAQLIVDGQTVDEFRLELEVAPARPSSLTTEATANGVRLTWPANPEEAKTPLKYRIFKDSALATEVSGHEATIPGTLDSSYSITAYHPDSTLESPVFTAPFIAAGNYVREPAIIEVRQIRGSLSITNLTITESFAYTSAPTAATNRGALRLSWALPPQQVRAGESFAMIIHADLGNAPQTVQASVAPPPRLYGKVNEIPSEFQSDNAFVGYLIEFGCGTGCYGSLARLRIDTATVTPEFPSVFISFRLVRGSGAFSSSEFEGRITWNYRRVP